MTIHQFKLKEDIVKALDICEQIDDLWDDLEHMKVKFAEKDDPVSIYLNMAQRNLSSAKSCLVEIIPEDRI